MGTSPPEPPEDKLKVVLPPQPELPAVLNAGEDWHEDPANEAAIKWLAEVVSLVDDSMYKVSAPTMASKLREAGVPDKCLGNEVVELALHLVQGSEGV